MKLYLLLLQKVQMLLVKKNKLRFFFKKSNILEIKKVKDTLDNPFPLNISVEEALVLKMNTDLSDKQYQMIRNSALVHNVHISPTLHDI